MNVADFASLGPLPLWGSDWLINDSGADHRSSSDSDCSSEWFLESRRPAIYAPSKLEPHTGLQASAFNWFNKDLYTDCDHVIAGIIMAEDQPPL